MNLALFLEALQASWSKETSVAGDRLPVDNPARGQCDVSSLVVQDYFGGDIVRVHVDGSGYDENHYFNRLENSTVLDTTRMQYKDALITLADNPKDLSTKDYGSMRDWMLSDEDTRRRYK